EESWNHSIISGGTAASGSPYHMIHDEMATPGETISLRAKFDYNAVLHKDLQDEYVNFYIWGTGMTQWQEAGRFLTDSDGMIFLDLDPLPVGTYIVRAVVVGDLTHADGYVTVVASGRRAVVFDIDGTLTTSDSEVMQDWANFSTAEMYPYANQVVNHYVNLGYQIVMVTGRPYWLAADTRAWLTSLSMPATSVRFTSDNGTTISGQETELYKTTYLQDLVTRCGLQIIRAYGNATTDIGAYDAVGVPKAETFIIGDNAGVDNTQPIVCEGCGYQTHYLDFLSNETLPCGLPQ
ncbi:haloacid dehalogenase, partial [Myxococcota bacterium]|nr:haloacid dehalogenase [Myxococcota bacterium]MBU1536705.1 haloacid dehalogenase [Myxococcota bacterium]